MCRGGRACAGVERHGQIHFEALRRAQLSELPNLRHETDGGNGDTPGADAESPHNALGRSDHLWAHVGAHGHRWEQVGKNGHTWASMGTRGHTGGHGR